MKKGFITGLIALCISFSLFGCSNNSSNNSSSKNNTTVTTDSYKKTESSYTSTKKSTESSNKCQFKDSSGNRSCTNTATHGQLCDYHFNMLNDTYNDLVGY